MHKPAIVFIFLLLFFSCYAQNGRDPQGLRTGHWKEKVTSAYGNVTTEGNYKVIPFSKYDTIRRLGRECFEVKYKKSTPLLFYYGMKNGNISVKDGDWYMYDPAGWLLRIDYWSQGLNTGTKYFDDKGNLLQSNYKDYDNDTSFYLTYLDGQLFKKAFYPPENKNRQIEIYYPEDDLSISDAELNFTLNFLYKPSDTQYVILSSRKEITMYSISAVHHSIQIDGSFSAIRYPMKITPESQVILRLITKPGSLGYKMKDTIHIKTSEKEIYKIYCDIYAAHIDHKNGEILKELRLSRTKDRYLVIPSLGTVTGAFITGPDGESRIYDIRAITKIDLKEFTLGSYKLEISSCHTGGLSALIITD